MIFTLITIFLVGVILLMAIYTVLQFLGKFPARTIDDVRPYLRPTELQELEEILDPANEANFQFRLSPAEFRQLQPTSTLSASSGNGWGPDSEQT